MSELTTIARPYAKAAFDFALEQGQLDKWQAMLQFSAAAAGNEEIKTLLHSSLASPKIAEIFIAVCADQLDQYGQNFIRVMAENRRLAVLPMVSAIFAELCTQHQSIKDISVISATELTKVQKAKIIQAMQAKLNCEIRIVSQVDKSLIAGVIIRYDDTVIDGSSRGQLGRLSQELCL